MSEKQRALINFLLENPSATLEEAGLVAGYPAKSASSIACRTLKSHNVQQRMAELMDLDPALQDQALLEKMKEGLNSNKTTYASFEGKITDHETDADMSTRKEYLKLGLMVKGALTQKTEISGPGGGPVDIGNVALPSLSKEQLIALAKATT